MIFDNNNRPQREIIGTVIVHGCHRDTLIKIEDLGIGSKATVSFGPTTLVFSDRDQLDIWFHTLDNAVKAWRQDNLLEGTTPHD